MLFATLQTVWLVTPKIVHKSINNSGSKDKLHDLNTEIMIYLKTNR